MATVVVEDVLFYFTAVQQLRAITSIFRRGSRTRRAEERDRKGPRSDREEVLRERKRVTKLYRRLLHYYRTLASHLANSLWDLGVSTVYLGYPYFIPRMVTSSLQIWSYRKLAH
ncbi:MAG: transposase [Candidatus Aramenus sp.]|nr:transposase [Candidatus Aramenus sp.]